MSSYLITGFGLPLPPLLAALLLLLLEDDDEDEADVRGMLETCSLALIGEAAAAAMLVLCDMLRCRAACTLARVTVERAHGL